MKRAVPEGDMDTAPTTRQVAGALKCLVRLSCSGSTSSIPNGVAPGFTRQGPFACSHLGWLPQALKSLF